MNNHDYHYKGGNNFLLHLLYHHYEFSNCIPVELSVVQVFLIFAGMLNGIPVQEVMSLYKATMPCSFYPYPHHQLLPNWGGGGGGGGGLSIEDVAWYTITVRVMVFVSLSV